MNISQRTGSGVNVYCQWIALWVAAWFRNHQSQTPFATWSNRQLANHSALTHPSKRIGISWPVWASYQIRKIASCACAGNAGERFLPPSRFSDRDMHHGMCMTHVPWCMPGSLTRGFLWSRRWGKRSWHSRRMRSPWFYVSGKRLMAHHPQNSERSKREGVTTGLLTIDTGVYISSCRRRENVTAWALSYYCNMALSQEF